MTHFITGDDKYRELIYDDGCRSGPVTRRDSPSGYRFGRTSVSRVRARTALSRVNGYLKNVIEAIANAKVRRMERELRGIRFDRPDNNWVARNPGRTSVRED
jgi:hypothetical protein